MTRTPIEPSEIRKGDLIRCEWPDDNSREYRASRDGDNNIYGGTSRFFLLDRPTPAIELPVQPSLGWLTWRDGMAVSDATELGLWRTFHSPTTIACGDTSVPQSIVTAFTPATAVPTEALTRLRNQKGRDGLGATTTQALADFLTAVDRESWAS